MCDSEGGVEGVMEEGDLSRGGGVGGAEDWWWGEGGLERTRGSRGLLIGDTGTEGAVSSGKEGDP